MDDFFSGLTNSFEKQKLKDRMKTTILRVKPLYQKYKVTQNAGDLLEACKVLAADYTRIANEL